ncbi:MAG: quinone oxidoreductase [Woeseiaceae bacterium]|nr:quinone oxidoreductase [Woeseiaceae bacterium]
MSHAIRIHEFGGPDVLRWETADLPPPGAGEVRLRHTAIGLNFIDTYHRDGLYPVPLPTVLGREAAGVVESLGDGVDTVAVGDRVVYTGGALGSYSEARNLDASLLVPIPGFLDDDTAAAIFLKGLTAWYLLHFSYAIRPGDPVLLYAAAGGVGTLASQWARRLGAIVIGVVSTAEKAELAKAAGCDHIVYADAEDLVAEVRDLSGGGVAAVYDSVGRDTFMTSLDCLRPHGVMVTFGNASGAVEPFAPAELAKRGSLYVTRPILEHFIDTRARLLDAAATLFDFVNSEQPTIRIGQRYPLADAAQAHRDLQARRTTGSSLLVP